MKKTTGNVRILSDGTAAGTRVFVNSVHIANVTKVEIDTIEPNKPITATITIIDPKLDVAIYENNHEIIIDDSVKVAQNKP